MAGLLPKVDRSKTIRSRDYRGSSSFATFLIVGRKSSGFHSFSLLPTQHTAIGEIPPLANIIILQLSASF